MEKLGNICDRLKSIEDLNHHLMSLSENVSHLRTVLAGRIPKPDKTITKPVLASSLDSKPFLTFGQMSKEELDRAKESVLSDQITQRVTFELPRKMQESNYPVKVEVYKDGIKHDFKISEDGKLYNID